MTCRPCPLITGTRGLLSSWKQRVQDTTTTRLSINTSFVRATTPLRCTSPENPWIAYTCSTLVIPPVNTRKVHWYRMDRSVGYLRTNESNPRWAHRNYLSHVGTSAHSETHSNYREIASVLAIAMIGRCGRQPEYCLNPEFLRLHLARL